MREEGIVWGGKGVGRPPHRKTPNSKGVLKRLPILRTPGMADGIRQTTDRSGEVEKMR